MNDQSKAPEEPRESRFRRTAAAQEGLQYEEIKGMLLQLMAERDAQRVAPERPVVLRQRAADPAAVAPPPAPAGKPVTPRGVWTSEFWVSLAGVLVVLANELLGLDLDVAEIAGMAGIIATYVLGRGAIKIKEVAA